MGNLNSVDLATSDIGRDAWGRPKVIIDRSLFSALFTTNVSDAIWEQYVDSVKQAAIGDEAGVYRTVSESGRLYLSSAAGGSNVLLRTKEHMRYRPNKGQLYSTAAFITVTDGIVRFGMFTDDSGVFFENDSTNLYAVTRTTVNGSTNDTRQLITTFPAGYDATKGNVYDIQFQWRGVGNYYFYINQELVATISNLGTLSNLSMYNPALPASFEVIKGALTTSTLEIGCVDISSEGGDKEDLLYGSLGITTNTGSVSISGTGVYNYPIIALRSKEDLSVPYTVGGAGSATLQNTRDTKILRALGYASQNAILRIWKTRANFATAITINGQAWTDYGDGHLEYIIVDPTAIGGPMTFTSGQATIVGQARVVADGSFALDGFNDENTEWTLTPGDLIVVTMHRETGAAIDVGATLEFAEKV